MKTCTADSIKQAARRGVAFHVVCDHPNYIDGKWVGSGLYHSSYASFEIAKVIASREDNGVVYNSELCIV